MEIDYSEIKLRKELIDFFKWTKKHHTGIKVHSEYWVDEYIKSIKE